MGVNPAQYLARAGKEFASADRLPVRAESPNEIPAQLAQLFRRNEQMQTPMVNELLTTEWDGAAVVGAIGRGHAARGADAGGWLVVCGVVPGRVGS